MRRHLYHPLAWCLPLAGVLGLLAALGGPGGLAEEALPRTPKADKLEHAGYIETLPGGTVKFELVPIPGGTYWMGSPKDEKGRADDEGPQHAVKLRPFWMGRYEVT